MPDPRDYRILTLYGAAKAVSERYETSSPALMRALIAVLAQAVEHLGDDMDIPWTAAMLRYADKLFLMPDDNREQHDHD